MSLPAKKLDQILIDRLSKRLEDRSLPELIRELLDVVPYPKAFLIESICDYCTPQELRDKLASYEAQDACEREGAAG